MHTFFKKLLFFYFIFLATKLLADGSDIRITVTDAAPVYEYTPSASFTIQLSQAPGFFDVVAVNYTTLNGSAQAGSDYTTTNGTVYFMGMFGQTTKTVTVPIIDDSNYELTENFRLSISNSDLGYVVTRSQGVATIYDDDVKPLILNSFFDKGIIESDSSQTVTLVAQFNQTLTSNVIVNYHTVDDTATKGSDYIPILNGSVTALAGTNRALIPLTVKGDSSPENTERFHVILDSVSQGSLSDDLAYVYLGDDDTIKVSVSSTDVNEGNVGDHNQMQFKIALAKPYPLTAPLTINYQTQDGSNPSANLADSDYISKSGTVTFNKGDIEKIVMVDIVGDNKIEPNENLKMVISGSRYIVVATTESRILNDDGSYPGLTFSTTNFSVAEGNSSQRDINFTLRLDAPALAGSSFEYYTQDNTALSSDSDYVAITPTLYSIPVGATVITIPVKINGDTKIENDESFYLKIQNGVNLNIIGGTVNGNIVNDDGSYPKLSFDLPSYVIFEGDSNSSHDLNITLQLDNPATTTMSFNYYTFDGSAQVSNGDYTAIVRTTYNIQVGEQNITIPVTIIGDNQIESNEYFYFKIDNEHNLTIGSIQQVQGFILNDDGSFPKVSINTLQTKYLEGDSNKTKVAFSIALDAPARENNVSVQYKSYDGTAKLADSDYVDVPQTTVTFNKGEQQKNLFAYINSDSKVENDEQFSLKIYTPYHAQIDSNNSQVLFTILNDDNSSNQPFTCDSKMYISSSVNRVTGATNRMWLHEIDTTQNPFHFKILNDVGTVQKYNAITYNPDDNYIYGLYHKELLRFSRTGDLSRLGVVNGLPNRFSNKQLYAGAIYGGYYYVTGRRGKYPEMYKIRLLDKNVTTITLSKKIAIQDFSFSSNGQFLYGVGKQGKLTKIDASTGAVIEIGAKHKGFAFDSSYSDVNDRFFANDSNGHGFYEFDLQTGAKSFISNSQPATFNDGANCLNAPLIFTDYGDAPSSYGSARHNIANGVYLGQEVDHDVHAYSSVNADGDDANGIDDEDGVTMANGSAINGSLFAPNSTQFFKVTASKAGYLNAWIDYNADGDFNDVGEKIFTAKSLTAGVHTLNITVPSTVSVGQNSYIRFRFSSTANLDAIQSASDGEVEDYKIAFGFLGIKGRFNIERTNSSSKTIMTDERNAWYTQIVGRDFDYSLVFYEDDFSTEKNISDVTLRVDLMDMDTNTSLYQNIFYIDNTTSLIRKSFTLPNDLDNLPATKNARFKVKYGVNASGNIVQGNCMKFPNLCTDYREDLANDNFAIRPEAFYLSLSDGSIVRKENNTTQNPPLRIAAGYDYNLTAMAIQYNSNLKTIKADNYSGTTKTKAIFNDKLNLNCSDRNDTTPIYDTFINSLNTQHDFNVSNVGSYSLHIEDTTWSSVDTNKSTTDCIVGDSSTSANGNTLSGCNIVSNKDMNLSVYPYRFNVTLEMHNLPNSGHDDFIYMNDVTIDNSVALQFEGNITAQNENNDTTSNFTAGCVAQNIVLTPLINVLTDDGLMPIKTAPHPTRAREDRNISREVVFNGVTNSPSQAHLVNMNAPLNIASNLFLDDQNGTVDLDVRYNIEKHLSLPTNPVQMVIDRIGVESVLSSSTAEGMIDPNPYVPSGSQGFNNAIRNFYFARVASDKENYPKINFTQTQTIRTPLNVEIFCNANIAYCTQTGIRNNTDTRGLSKVSDGWYISIHHNTNLDGNVTALVPNSAIVAVNPNNNIPFTDGRNSVIMNRFNAPNALNGVVRVTINPPQSLLYHEDPLNNGNPFYTISCSPNAAGMLSGIGQTGQIIDINSSVSKTSKMDW